MDFPGFFAYLMDFPGFFAYLIDFSWISLIFRRNGGIFPLCWGLVGPKSENVQKVLVFKAFLEGSRESRGIRDRLRLSEPG